MSADLEPQNILELITNPDLDRVDLDNCDREPIHIPNLIQPHGVLVTICVETEQILQVSLNTQEILSLEPEELLGQSLTEFLGEQQTIAVKKCLSGDFEHVNPLAIELTAIDSTLYFDGIVHRQGEVIILELEPKLPTDKASFDNFYHFVQNPLKRLQKTKDLESLCNTLAQEIKAITGFDRVMVYRLDRDGAGSVIAEAVEPELEPFLGLHYPATDIPKQAKYLYTLNLLRLIPDVKYEPAGLTPHLNPLTNQPLDMSMAVLRSISPLHIEYLSNMGVSATMCISLVKDNQLWGLVACHHNTPKQVNYEIRTICEFIAQIVSSELAAKEKSQDSDYKIKLKSIQAEFVTSLSQAGELEMGLVPDPQKLLDLVGADGVALSFGSEITTLGNSPSKSEIKELLPWLETQFDRDVIYETNSLVQSYPEASAYADIASGLMALLVSRVDRTLIIWFRPEVMQTVNWGGNPHNAVVTQEDGTSRMSPRKSFAKWQEIVRERSLPWKACEVEAALELRSSIVGIILRKADELASINRELSRSNIELDAFAYIASHDLKEPLRGIYNYSSFLIEDYGEILGSDGADKLNTLMRLSQRMEDLINSLLHYSRLGRAELLLKPVDLNDLLAGVLDVIKASARDTQVEFIIPRPLPTVQGDRTQLEELLTNLISNGIKYNRQAQKTIEIGYLEPRPVELEPGLEYSQRHESKTVFYVRDNGIGIREKHLESVFRIFKRLHGQKKYGGGTGAGLTISQKIVERHGGEIWIESIYGAGSTFYFTLE